MDIVTRPGKVIVMVLIAGDWETGWGTWFTSMISKGCHKLIGCHLNKLYQFTKYFQQIDKNELKGA